MKIIEEKRLRRYVIASLGNPTLYVFRAPFVQNDYALTDDVDYAMKLTNASDARTLKNYYNEHERPDEEFVVLPINIVYELVNEYE